MQGPSEPKAQPLHPLVVEGVVVVAVMGFEVVVMVVVVVVSIRQLNFNLKLRSILETGSPSSSKNARPGRGLLFVT